MLTQQPDLSCVTFTSAELSMGTILQLPCASFYDAANAKNSYNPIDHVSKVRANLDRDVFVVWADQDIYSPPVNQKEYAEALGKLGHRVHLMEGEAIGVAHHTLDRTGRMVHAWRLKGMDPKEIEERVRSREVKG